LLLQSFMRAWNVNPGFDVQNVYEINFTLVGPKYADDKTVVRAQAEALDRVRRIPGVDAAAIVSTPPLAGSYGSFDQSGFVIQDRRIPDPQVPSVDRYIVSPGYFRTTGISILRGREFNEADASSPNQVAIISESAASQIFPGEEALGRRIQLGGRHDDQFWATIVGIAGDVHQYGLDSPVTPQAYVLYSHSPSSGMVLLVRSAINSTPLTRAIQEQIWSVDKSSLVFNPVWMTELVSNSLAQRRFTVSLLGGFGALALLLAAIGIYGVLSCTVAQRTNEIGIRVALGASTVDVTRMVLQEAMLLTFLAVTTGWAVALVFARVLRTLLFEVQPTDPLTLLLVSCVVMLVAGVAALTPARRAVRVDPMVALRYE
jgi:putative ABC transport system permease protein